MKAIVRRESNELNRVCDMHTANWRRMSMSVFADAAYWATTPFAVMKAAASQINFSRVTGSP
jgi:hypothetical protein